jgi:pimeloyl-ACP methyl ester carboxylesterase
MTTTNAQTGYVAVNGLKLYYKIHGSGGHPLVLLHGAAMLIPMLVPFLNAPMPDAKAAA